MRRHATSPSAPNWKWAPAGYYGLEFGSAQAQLSQGLPDIHLAGKVAVPYALNQNFVADYIGREGAEYKVNWNGITSTLAPTTPTAQTQAEAGEIASQINSIIEGIKAIDICPHRRGFFKPSYSPAPISSTPTSEDEVASLIINDPNLAPRISIDLDDIFGRDFRLHTVSGTATSFLQTTDKKSRMPVYLVNDGFGVNQVVYMLAKLHRQDVKTLLIEEPEVHLHPSVIRKFARTVCSIVKEDGKQCVFATHSEQFVISVLNCVAEGLLKPDDVACYHVVRDRRITKYERQHVSENGQVEGGLSSFIEGEMEDLKRFISAG